MRMNHSLGQYSGHKETHTNGIESIWALIKRRVFGMYHYISVKYIQKYIGDFCFRLNNRKNESVFDTPLRLCVFG
ncbi:MAG: transposase [Methanocalculaceae archaeon]|nr:transposase [Methanocalculaceae archaeon]